MLFIANFDPLNCRCSRWKRGASFDAADSRKAAEGEVEGERVEEASCEPCERQPALRTTPSQVAVDSAWRRSQSPRAPQHVAARKGSVRCWRSEKSHCGRRRRREHPVRLGTLLADQFARVACCQPRGGTGETESEAATLTHQQEQKGSSDLWRGCARCKQVWATTTGFDRSTSTRRAA